MTVRGSAGNSSAHRIVAFGRVGRRSGPTRPVARARPAAARDVAQLVTPRSRAPPSSLTPHPNRPLRLPGATLPAWEPALDESADHRALTCRTIGSGAGATVLGQGR